MSDPFLITGPAVISFSGGRTSAYMLWRILQAHGGTLPDDVLVCFANTGREVPATLDFVWQCGTHWNVSIVWLEYRHMLIEGKRRRVRWAEVVGYNSASRNGEPFDMLLESKKIVPDMSRRFCTWELKVITIVRYLRETYGWKEWTNVVGFRADEGERVEERHRNEIAHPVKWHTSFPLADAGVEELEVLQFWKKQPFRLRLDKDGDGGNCDGCFMFSSARLGRMFQKYPERMDWWVLTEKRLGTKTMRPNESYEDIRRVAEAQGVLPWDNGAPCNQACGV